MSKISVIMGIYNCEATLAMAIESVMSQTYTDFELIMCDDGSTDGTYGIALSYAERFGNVKVLKNEKDTLQEILKMKIHEIKVNSLQELNKVEDEMKRHFSHQSAENGRLQQQIASLKAEKTALQNQLIALQRRISDLEMQVGTDDVKF